MQISAASWCGVRVLMQNKVLADNSLSCILFCILVFFFNSCSTFISPHWLLLLLLLIVTQWFSGADYNQLENLKIETGAVQGHFVKKKKKKEKVLNIKDFET